ncbi:glucosaminidase domain-containing protein [Staphylococcus sp. IVB6227]|uniref:glucosaminidase domain-containing protein n=1 Tax=Staphylococcus sp. IVB6227 TaxID=2989768 RepID=UPI0021D35273|nr:glucosaminidase domain-containing protein [Staphylococcus sp. IVB6227]UXR79065.1 glucosaminidase domain-containing protein [Staphylococcus sp. IVB6227]
MSLPSSGKPTASQVIDWAKDLEKRRVGIDVDGFYGYQCWDLPNYILKRYWGFTTWGNANAMAQKSNYRGYDFKIYRNTSSFIPKPGDWAVWAGSNPGHVNIVVGPSTSNYFWAVNQNWRNSNSYRGSPASLDKHSYNGVTHFVRPPYKQEVNQNTTEQSSEPMPNKTADDIEVRFKEIKKITYTIIENTISDDFETINHYIDIGDVRKGKVKGITIKNANTMRGVVELYRDRDKLKEEVELPHYYVDRNKVWHCRRNSRVHSSDPDNIVIEICEDLSLVNDSFAFNEIRALITAYQVAVKEGLNFSQSTIKANKEIWRSLKMHVGWDFLKNGYPDSKKYDELEKAFIKLYNNREKIFSQKPKENFERFKIKTTAKNKNSEIVQQLKNESGVTGSPKITIEKSKYTFNQALNLQMSRGQPMKSVSYGWIQATRTQTSDAMEPNRIWNNSTQRYQMLNLGKYQGVPVSKLNQILSGKGTLHNQGQMFATACKRYNLNEIYLIAHAFLESAYGKSNFASGTYGIYNFFGINAIDSNPNLAINFARNEGWTSPEKGITGGAKFVREDYIGKGQNTLYRMRWNPKKPATHQYATAIEWCQHQATTIANLYKQIGLQGVYYTQDQYK